MSSDDLKRYILAVISLHLDILCGSARTIKELAFQPKAKGNSAAREIATTGSNLPSRDAQKIVRQGSNIRKWHPKVAR